MAELSSLDDSNYAQWSMEELKAVCELRFIETTNVPPAVVIARLEGYDIGVDLLADLHVGKGCNLIQENFAWYAPRFVDLETRKMYWSRGVRDVMVAKTVDELSPETIERAERCPWSFVQEKLKALRHHEKVDIRPLLAKHPREGEACTGEVPEPVKRHHSESRGSSSPCFQSGEEVIVANATTSSIVWTVMRVARGEDGWIYDLTRKESRQVEYSSLLMYNTRQKIAPKEEGLCAGDTVLYVKDGQEHLAKILRVHKAFTPYWFDIQMLKVGVGEDRLSKTEAL